MRGDRFIIMYLAAVENGRSAACLDDVIIKAARLNYKDGSPHFDKIYTEKILFIIKFYFLGLIDVGIQG